jgi:hypothetical protein
MAENCFREALSMDDANEAVHQLWIANLSQANRGQEALDWYEQRLAHDAGDETALKFRSVARLTLQYKQQDFAADYQKAEPAARTRVEKLFKPTRANLAGTAGGAVMCALVALLLAFIPAAEQGGDAPAANTFADPVTWGYFSLCFASLFGLLWWSRN